MTISSMLCQCSNIIESKVQYQHVERKLKGKVEDLHLYMKSLRGSAGYWRTALNDLIAQIRCLGHWETIVVDATDDDGNEAAAELDADGQHSVDCFSYRDACPIDVFSFVDTFCSKPRTGSEVDAQWHAIRSHLTSGRNIHLTTMVNEVEIVQNDRLASNLHSIAMSQTDFFLPPDFKTIYFLPAFEWMMVDLKTLVEPWCVKVYYEQDRTKGRKPSQSLRKDEILNSARIDVSRIDSIDNMTTGIYNLHFFTYFSITPDLYDTYVIENQQYVKAPFAVSGGTVFQGHSFVLYEFVRDVRPNSAAAAAAAVAAF
ncbi:hypothetical protein M8J76_014921 [Diaphorina citri]|nr:hypothetical protein M8J76_014921 [Diaphorina citri]